MKEDKGKIKQMIDVLYDSKYIVPSIKRDLYEAINKIINERISIYAEFYDDNDSEEEMKIYFEEMKKLGTIKRKIREIYFSD